MTAALHATIENVSRRGFLSGLIATGGLVVAAEIVPFRAALAAYATGAAKMPGGGRQRPACLRRDRPERLVTIIAHRAEMGTGAKTSLPMAVADELEADWSRVKIVQSPGDEKKYGNQNTDGSRSIRHFIQPMRECGAAMRQMLEAAAAQRWGVGVAEVQAQNHEVVHKPSGRKLGYGELAARRERLADAAHRSDQAQGSGRLPLSRQGQRPDRRSFRHHHRPGGLRHRHQASRDEIRRCRPAAGDGRQARLL